MKYTKEKKKKALSMNDTSRILKSHIDLEISLGTIRNQADKVLDKGSALYHIL